MLHIHSSLSIRAFISTVAAFLVVASGVRADWPEFRGPTRDGHVPAAVASAATFPLEWSEASGVVWKTSVPHRGWSTPVMLDGRLWLTTATRDGRDLFVLCVDGQSGEILRNIKLLHVADPEPLGNGVNSYASPSPVAGAGRVYVHFGSYGTACLEAATADVVWLRRDLPCRHYRGPGSSLVLWRDTVIVTMDGVDVQYMAALDKATGATVWRTDRTATWNDLGPDGKPKREGDFRKAYSTPVLAEIGGSVQILSTGAKAVYGYDARSGHELWKVGIAGFSAAPRPLFHAGLALFCTGFGRTELLAVRPGTAPRASAASVVWRTAEHVPKTTSSIATGGLLFTVSDRGVVSCMQIADGVRVWQERLGGNYAASPLLAGDRLYLCSAQGKSVVMRAGRAAEILATNRLDDGCMASPVAADGALFLRTKTHLYRLEAVQ